MDAYDAMYEAMRRKTCRYWGRFETFMVMWSAPRIEWMCDLTEERNPNCVECERYTPKPP